MTICSSEAMKGNDLCPQRLRMAYHRGMQLLLVEDELEIQNFLKTSLADAGYEVDVAGDGRAAETFASARVYDALIVDLGLPDQDGIDLILRLRRLGVSSPVMILSARRSVDDRVAGLEQGGDDYLTKPFALAELLARLRNLLKRNAAAGASPTMLQVGDLELDLLRRRASRGRRAAELESAGVCAAGISVPACGAGGDEVDAARGGVGDADSAGHECGGRAYLPAAR